MARFARLIELRKTTTGDPIDDERFRRDESY
jgi:hypothetical protein